MMEVAGVTEELKACDPMRWVGLMNTCLLYTSYLQDHELLDYAVLSEKAAVASAHFNELSARIKSDVYKRQIKSGKWKV